MDKYGIKPLNQIFDTITEFDKLSARYEENLTLGISLSGENSDYFARHRVDHMAKLHAGFNSKTETIMDYGCGTGGSVGHLLKAFNPTSIVATDVSEKSLGILRQKYKSKKSGRLNPSRI